jgi:hypothetical protein
MAVTPIKIQTLKIVIDDGIKKRPMYIGSLDAKSLNTICSVPSYSTKTKHYEIANNILTPPSIGVAATSRSRQSKRNY